MKKISATAPDILIIGAQRCASTWLARVLREFPEIWAPEKLKPEPKIFLNFPPTVTQRGFNAEMFDRLQEAVYSAAYNHKLVLDKTTRYLADPTAPKAAVRANPDMKIFVMLRDPSDRAWSHWRYSKSEGVETSPFDQAVAAEPARALLLPKSEHHKFAYMGNGLYGFHLSMWMQEFNPEQFCVCFLEELDEPEKLLQKMADFLGLEVPDVKLPGVVNAAPDFEEEVNQEVWDTQDWLQNFFRPDMELLDAVLRDTLEMNNPYLR